MSRSILKEYLISLGFSVDDQKYKTATGKLKSFEKKATKVAEGIGRNMSKGAKVTATALSSITTGVAAYVSGVAQADMETEKFARRMWMTETNARSLQYTLKAMGESMDSIYDVAANPELRERFFKLRADAYNLEGGAEIDKGLRELREFQFEFQRFQLLMSYGSRYVAYYLSKYLAFPMAQIKEKLKSINDNGRGMLEEWGEKIAKLFSWMIRLALAGVEAGEDLLRMIHKMPAEIQLVVATLSALGFAALNPFTLMIAAIGTILLLLDDFYTWQRGGKSLLGDTWSQLDSMDFGSKSMQNIQKLLKNTGSLFDTLGEKWKNLNETVKDKTGFTILENVLLGVDTVVGTIADGLASIIELIDRILNDDPPQWFKNILFGLNGTTEAKEETRLTEYETKQKASKQEIKVNLPEWLQQLRQQKDQKVFTLPVFSGPTAPAEQLRQVVNHNNRKEIKQENKAEMNNTFIVNGTDASAITKGIANRQQTLLNQFSGSWFNNAVKLPE